MHEGADSGTGVAAQPAPKQPHLLTVFDPLMALMLEAFGAPKHVIAFSFRGDVREHKKLQAIECEVTYHPEVPTNLEDLVIECTKYVLVRREGVK